MSASIHVALWQVAASLVLVAIAIAISHWRQADLERDIGVATIRSIVQLTLVGYAIKLIFEADTFWLVLVAARRDGGVRGADRAQPRQERPGRLLAVADRPRRRGRDAPSAWSSRSGSSNRRPATWSRSGGW